MEAWKNNFSVDVIKRGYDYYCDDAVEQVVLNDDVFEAKVHGSSLYDVKIKMVNGKITMMQCNCPCTYHCKHMVAALYNIENGNYINKREVENEIDQFINSIPSMDLKGLVKEACLSDDNFYQRLIIKYSTSISKQQLADFETEIINLYPDDYRYYSYDDLAIKYQSILTNYVNNKLSILADGGHLDATLHLFKKILSEMDETELFDDYDDDNYLDDEFCQAIENLFIKMYVASDDRDKLIKELTQLKERRELRNIIEVFFVDYLEDNVFRNDKLSELEQEISDGNPDAVIDKVVLMEKMDFPKAAINELLDEYYEYRCVRMYLIKKYESENRSLDAIAVLEDCISYDDYYWDKQKLIKLYKQNGMEEQWATAAYDYFININQNINMFKELKAYYGSDWQNKRSKIYAAIDRDEIVGYYDADGEYEKIWEIASTKESLGLMERYFEQFKINHEKELFKIYYEYVKSFVEDAKNNYTYDTLFCYIKKLLQLDQGIYAMRELRNDWMERFPTRRALINRLKNLNI